jgi:small ligand-binding sensory domain FIST
MRFTCALSTASDLEHACREAAERARERHGTEPVDLAVVFAAASYPGKLDPVPVLLHELLSPRCLVGCSGGGIIGEGRELEAKPAVSVTLATMEGVGIHPIHVTDGDLPDADSPPSAWTGLMGLPPEGAAGFLVLPEPFTFAADRLLAGLDYAYPTTPKVGGIASGSRHPGGHSLFLNRACHQSGAVLLGLSGNLVLETVVAQGCKPIGKVGQITRAERNLLIAVNGKPAVQFLQEQLENLEEQDVDLARQAIFVGIAMNPFAVDEPGPGDFLIRNVMGVDLERGVLSVAENLSVGRAVQLHLRDKHASDQDLRAMLSQRSSGARPCGGLLFSCLGRGEHLYGEADHDSRVFAEEIGPTALGGFFCNGEIGPVGDTTYLHGYTSSFALFHPGERVR